jgi:hypothetical protein
MWKSKIHRRGTEFGGFLNQEVFTPRPPRLGGVISEPCFTTNGTIVSDYAGGVVIARLILLLVLSVLAAGAIGLGGCCGAPIAPRENRLLFDQFDFCRTLGC